MGMPWERVEKSYQFEGPNGALSLADLFNGRSQLIVYHFMFAPDWEEGCKSCSFWADNFNAIPIHLNHRDVVSQDRQGAWSRNSADAARPRRRGDRMIRREFITLLAGLAACVTGADSRRHQT